MTADFAADLPVYQSPQAVQAAERLLSKGIEYARKRQFERAIALLDQALEQVSVPSLDQGVNPTFAPSFPDNSRDGTAFLGNRSCGLSRAQRARAHYHRGCVLCSLKRYEQAIADFTAVFGFSAQAASTVREAIPESAMALRSSSYIHRGNAYRHLGCYALALADFNQGIELSGGTAQSYGARGLLRLDMQDPAGAIADFDQALAIHPTFAQAYLWRGFAWLRQQQYEQAKIDLTRAIEAIPSCCEAYNHRGVTYFYLSEFEAALADFDQAIRLDRQFAEAYNNRATVRQLLGDRAAALADYDRAIALDPLLAELYFNRAAVYGSPPTEGRESEAGAVEEQVIDDKESAEKGISLCEVAADYDKTAGLSLNEAAFYRHRGRVRAAQGRLSAAIADYTIALSIYPNAYGFYQRGAARLKLGQAQLAEADFTQAIARSPDYGDPYCDRSHLRFQSGDLAGALADADRAIALKAAELTTAKPGSAACRALRALYATRCLTHFCLAQADRAMADFEQLIALGMSRPASREISQK